MACTAEGVAPHVRRVAFDLEAGPVSPALQWLHDTIISTINTRLCTLQCFDAVGWAAGRASGL